MLQAESGGNLASVEYHARRRRGWLIRYMHSTGISSSWSSTHVPRCHGSYKPRELVWLLGMLIYLVLMAEASSARAAVGPDVVLGAKVHHHLPGAIPYVGDALTEVDPGPPASMPPSTASSPCTSSPCRWCCCWSCCTSSPCTSRLEQSDGVEIRRAEGHRWSPTAPADGIPFITSTGHLLHGLLPVIGLHLSLSRPPAAGSSNTTTSSRPAPRHAGPHQAGLVPHAVLRDVARGPGQTARRAGLCSARSRVVLPALARSRQGEVMAPSRHRLPRGHCVLGICFVWLGKIGAGPAPIRSRRSSAASSPCCISAFRVPPGPHLFQLERPSRCRSG